MTGEEALAGGNVAPVVRVGDTVHRATGPWSPAVHRLLRHLEDVGFPESPRVLGTDEHGREILTYLPGETVAGTAPWPAWAWSDDALIQVAALLRRYHDAVRDFPTSGTWRVPGRPVGPGDVVCHNDLAPYNVVWRDGRITGVIDWDVAAPGPPEWDLAFLAWAWVPLNAPAERAAIGAPDDVERRLRLLLDGYGSRDRGGFAQLVVARIAATVEGIALLAQQGDAALQGLIDGGHLARMQRDLDHARAHAHEWQAAITPPGRN